MNNIVINYAYHLDNIRISKKISVAKLCEGICDTRLYRRFRTGEKTLTHLKIIEFCEKLSISPSEFYYSASEKDRYEFAKINVLYSMIYSKNYENFQNTLSTIKEEQLLSSHNRKYLHLCIIKSNFYNKLVPDPTSLSELSELINYPDCLKNEAFDFIDLAGLLTIAEIEVRYKKTTAVDRLIIILQNEDFFYISSESRHVLPSIFSNVCLLLARLDRYEESLKISMNGVKYYIDHTDMSSLTLLRYIKSYSMLQLGQRGDAEIEAIKCILNSISQEYSHDIDMFQKSIIKDFSFDPVDAIPIYKDQLLKKSK